MKTLLKSVSITLVLVLALFAAIGCKEDEAAELWKDALYTEDTTLGSGAKTVTVSVSAEDKTVVFTIKTDKTILGDALAEHNLIQGEQGAYGLYIKTVNGIKADYDTDGYYWGFYQNGDYMMTGVDGTEISGGESYELVRTN